MPRWPNGAPKKLYILVANEDGDLLAFATKKERTAYLVEEFGTYPDDMFTFMTYAQEAK